MDKYQQFLKYAEKITFQENNVIRMNVKMSEMMGKGQKIEK